MPFYLSTVYHLFTYFPNYIPFSLSKYLTTQIQSRPVLYVPVSIDLDRLEICICYSSFFSNTSQNVYLRPPIQPCDKNLYFINYILASIQFSIDAHCFYIIVHKTIAIFRYPIHTLNFGIIY